ncbi:MAG: fibronectin type III domain-containing protein [Verrucomicrobia bacterium]|jgi:hypothetical protein|nr:fibronectin type III domain-containing protein [Verrucomicrobiota bacterium]MBT7066820.1 fibronectin type III domain-containing protein [Verrucomicrobiota bacterium]MBT7698764.1 fibronectin type III domain-containing protein [Verrucomicrobiota bacterium]
MKCLSFWLRSMLMAVIVGLAMNSSLAVTLENTGFETPDFGTGWEYFKDMNAGELSSAVWTFTGGAGLAGPGSPWVCNSTSPDPLGDQFAYLQGGASVSQTLSGLIPGNRYYLTFSESYRTAMDPDNDLAVIIDEGLGSEDTIYYTSAVNNTAWETRQTEIFTAGKSSYSLTFRAIKPLAGGDRTTIIDGVVVVELPSDSPITFSNLAVSNITDTAAWPYATLNTNLTSVTLVWDTEDMGDTNDLVWTGSRSLSTTNAGGVTGNATNLNPDTEYSFRFFGEDASTNGWSGVATFDTQLTDASKPVFTSTNSTFYSITLEWDDNAATETGYILHRSTNGVDYAFLTELDAGTTNHTDDGLLSEVTYHYQLAATNDVNKSSTAFSACATNATTASYEWIIDWTPELLPSTELWLDAADKNTVLTSGGSVTNWSDKSGNDRDATQITATKQATYNATGFSGLPTLEFASGDEMAAGIPTNTFSSGINVYMVLKKHAYIYGDSYPFLRLKSGKAAPFRGRWDTSGYWNYRYVGNGVADTGCGRFSNFPATDTPLLVSIAIDATTYTEMYNAVNAWSGAHGGTYGDTASDVIIGKGASDYSISEVVVTDFLSTTNRYMMEGYLAWKWGMEAKLPESHLFKDAPPETPPPAGTLLIFR